MRSREDRGPRGLAHADDRARAVAQLVIREGLTARAAAEKLGLKPGTVSAMVLRVRAAEQEERNRRAG